MLLSHFLNLFAFFFFLLIGEYLYPYLFSSFYILFFKKVGTRLKRIYIVHLHLIHSSFLHYHLNLNLNLNCHIIQNLPILLYPHHQHLLLMECLYLLTILITIIIIIITELIYLLCHHLQPHHHLQYHLNHYLLFQNLI